MCVLFCIAHKVFLSCVFHTSARACTHPCILTRTYARTHIHTRIYFPAHTNTLSHTLPLSHTHTYTHTRTHTHVHKRTHIHNRAHTYTHSQNTQTPTWTYLCVCVCVCVRVDVLSNMSYFSPTTLSSLAALSVEKIQYLTHQRVAGSGRAICARVPVS